MNRWLQAISVSLIIILVMNIVLFALGIIFEEIFIIGWSVGIFVGFLTLAVYLVLQKEKK